METNSITSFPTPREKTTIRAIIKKLDNAFAGCPRLDDAARKRLRNQFNLNDGYYEKVYGAVLNFKGAIIPQVSLDHVAQKKTELDELFEYRDCLMAAVNKLNDAIFIHNSELLKDANILYSQLKASSRSNTEIEHIVQEIADAYKSKQFKKPISFIVGPRGNVTVDRVIPRSRLVNIGSTVIRFKPHRGDIHSVPFVVEPSRSEVIPDGVTSIEVTNESISSNGNFTVMTR